jgi:hypothetical protein
MSAKYMNCSKNYTATVSYCPRQKKRIERSRDITAAFSVVIEKNTLRSLDFVVVINNRDRNRH